MSVMSYFDTERCLIWKVAVPSYSFPHKSPDFYFRNCRCRFEFKLRFDLKFYDLWITCEEPHFLQPSHPLHLTSYKDDPKKPHSFQTTLVGLFPCLITSFPIPTESDDLNPWRTTTRIGIIIHGECRFPFKFEKSFKDVAVGPDAESDTTSSTCAESTLEILSSDFSKLLDEDMFQDVELQCEGHTFKAHKSVLSSRSKVFLAMLQSDMLEGQTARVEVKDMRLDVCKDLLHYMYTGKLPELTSENTRYLYEAADRYNVGGLMKPCAEFLARNLTPDNACERLVLADSHSDQNFKVRVIEFILDEKIPLKDDLWQPFCRIQPLLANEVLNRSYKLQNKQ